MATKQLTLPGPDVKKHNDLVRSKINLDSLQGSRILAALIASIQPGSTKFKESYSVAVKSLLSDSGGGSYRQIKAICRDLGKATVEFEVKDVTNWNGDPLFVVLPFFMKVKYHKGIVEAQFNPSSEIADCLLALNAHFTAVNLIEYLRLPSLYSQRIFEILMSWKRTHQEVEIPLADLHQWLNVPESFKANFKEFRRWVLEKAHKDIHDSTDLEFVWEPVKQGRGVAAVRFIFSPGRRVEAAAAGKKRAQEKKSKANNDLMQMAYACFEKKAGVCAQPVNKPKVCALCLEYYLPQS
jgi:plasmid replication initiation protein